jgi:hypothetical protein
MRNGVAPDDRRSTAAASFLLEAIHYNIALR